MTDSVNTMTDTVDAIAQRIQSYSQKHKDAHTAGIPALRRLFDVAQRDTGQSSVVANFLLGLYNGLRFPFDLTELRRLDSDLLEDCLLVLRMDASPVKEVHLYYENGGARFEQMARVWNLPNASPA